MSKLVYICHRDGVNRQPYTSADIQELSERLTPDNIDAHPPHTIDHQGILIGIFNPMDVIPIQHQSVCLGQMFGMPENWWKPRTELPDGTYALFRGDEDTIEIVTDRVASRTVWFVHTEQILIASTSQRAIITLLGDFEPNEAVYPWMLSTGSLGPSLSWDKRIKCLKGNSRLLLDRKSWTLTIREEPIRFTPSNLKDVQQQALLSQDIDDTFDRLDIDLSKWILPLSGGIDSRALLMQLKKRGDIQTVTWGIRSALKRKKSDAFIARELSGYYNVPNKYLETDISDEPIERLFDRFLHASEGRVDHISGYMDGFRIWKQLFEMPYSGLIRGDQAFGCHAVQSPMDVYRNMNFLLLSDFCNLNTLLFDYYSQQHRPAILQRQPDETMETWRDRLNMEFEIPAIFAALNDIKAAYIEITTPFFSRKIIKRILQLPDYLRTEKRLFRKIINDKVPGIPYAKHPAVAAKKDILSDQSVKNFVSEYIRDRKIKSMVPDVLVDYIFDEIDKQKHKKSSIVHTTVSSLAGRIKRRLTASQSERILDPAVLAFRVYILVRMTEILSEDAGLLKNRAVS